MKRGEKTKPWQKFENYNVMTFRELRRDYYNDDIITAKYKTFIYKNV